MFELLAAISYDPIQRITIPLPLLGDFGISPHGIGTAGGFLLGAWIMARRADPRGIPPSEVYNAVTWGAVGAILGARGFYVLAHADQFRTLYDVLAIWEGGLTMFGGFVGGLALGLWSLHRRGYDVPLALDAAAPGFVAGVIVGRIGDLAIADHLGDPTDFFLGYRIPQGGDLAPGYGPPTYVPGAVVHQTALYDLAGALVLVVVLALVARRRPVTGTLFATFSIWYGLQRFLIDFTRNTDIIESFFLFLSGSQWAGLGFAAGGVVFLRWSRTRAAAAHEERIPAPVGAPAEPPVEGVQRGPDVEAVEPGPDAAGVEPGAPPEEDTPSGWTPTAEPLPGEPAVPSVSWAPPPPEDRSPQPPEPEPRNGLDEPSYPSPEEGEPEPPPSPDEEDEEEERPEGPPTSSP